MISLTKTFKGNNRETIREPKKSDWVIKKVFAKCLFAFDIEIIEYE